MIDYLCQVFEFHRRSPVHLRKYLQAVELFGSDVMVKSACSYTLYNAGIRVNEPAQAALALKPLAGERCSILFAFGLFNASLFAASVLPLSTAYCVCEGMGWQTGVDRSFEEAPQFYGLYTLLIAAGALAVCWPGFPLIKVMYWSQVFAGLPTVAVKKSGRKVSANRSLSHA